MKKWLIALTAVLISLLSVSCLQSNPEKTAAVGFLQKLYSVSADETASFQSFVNSMTDTKTIDTTLMETLTAKFKPLMTDGAYQSLIANRTYSSYLQFAADKNQTMQCKDVSLSQKHKNGNVTIYEFTVKASLTDNDTQKAQDITESGTIQVEKGADCRVDTIGIDNPDPIFSPNAQ